MGVCSSCGGRGLFEHNIGQSNYYTTGCGTCGSTGQVKDDRPCNTCNGEGKTYESDISDDDGISVVGKWFPCDRCNGSGIITG